MQIDENTLKTGLDPNYQALTCKNCHNTYAYPADQILAQLGRRQPTPLRGVEEFGLLCPGCGYWYHIAYTNKIMDLAGRLAELERHPLRAAKLQASHRRRFKRFQETTAARLQAGAVEETGGA